MYSDFILLDTDNSTVSRIDRLAFGNTSGRNEAWLRDTLLEHPGLLPIHDLDPSYGPLIPLCRELRTTAGPIDAAFINPAGRLTFVECKLWRNPEARRKVVAQILDYARVVSRWSYSDLQRNVAIATGRHGNVPFELARLHTAELREHQFVDQTATALRQGRFQLIIAGDGIRDDVGAMAELITRNAALAFSFGLVELALYGLEDGRLLVQPRVIARTHVFERTLIVVQSAGSQPLVEESQEAGQASLVNNKATIAPEQASASAELGNALEESPRQAAYRRWWQPVIDMPLDDPDQEPPKLYWPNNVRLPLPWKDTWILAYCAAGKGGHMGVSTSGRAGADQEMLRRLEPQLQEILSELPLGTQYRKASSPGMTLACLRDAADFSNDEERRAWLGETINRFVNALRPRLKQFVKD